MSQQAAAVEALARDRSFCGKHVPLTILHLPPLPV